MPLSPLLTGSSAALEPKLTFAGREAVIPVAEGGEPTTFPRE